MTKVYVRGGVDSDTPRTNAGKAVVEARPSHLEEREPTDRTLPQSPVRFRPAYTFEGQRRRAT